MAQTGTPVVRAGYLYIAGCRPVGRPDPRAVGVPAGPVTAKGTWLRPLANRREGLPFVTDLALNRDVLKN
jgi:hypothetical protein